MPDDPNVQGYSISGIQYMDSGANAILLSSKPQDSHKSEPLRKSERPGKDSGIASVEDAVLVECAQKGDRKAFRELVERHQKNVAFTVVSMLGRTSEVDDVVQDVFLKCYQTLGKFRGEASFATYIKKMAVNKSLDVLRRRKRFFGRFLSRDDDSRYLEEPILDANDVVEASEQARMVHAAISSLPAKHRAVVVLRMIEGYSTQETAQMLDLAYGTVLSRLSRAQKKLKDMLAPLIT